MKILGIKYTHDSTVALVENRTLIFSEESEKIDNGNRYKKPDSINFPIDVLNKRCIDISNISNVVIDGWYKDILVKGSNEVLPVANYADINEDLLTETKSNCSLFDYSSYAHILGHMIGSYATSDFSKNEEPAYCVTWDGGQFPRVDYIEPNSEEKIKYIGSVHVMDGMIYEVIGLYVGPYKDETFLKDSARRNHKKKIFAYSIPGKIMSYIALGKINEELIENCFNVYYKLEENILGLELEKIYVENKLYLNCLFMEKLSKMDCFKRTDDASILLSIHTFLQRLFVKRLTTMIPNGSNLVFSGGSALNIKWNSALLRTNHFKDIWIPPFTNDTGSALGMACTELALKNNIWSIDWSVYSGPKLIENKPTSEWTKEEMSPEGLGKFLNDNSRECVVSLYGNSEIGPRSLGHRSLLMSPVHSENKTKLNLIKKRELFRPVAPICLLDDAENAFHLLKNDKYMLYEHTIKEDWKVKIPAVMHLDDSARVQVIEESDSDFVFRVLSSFKKESGIGILCNTSANYSGKGFFPDVKSACEWALENDVYYVWANGYMYKSI